MTNEYWLPDGYTSRPEPAYDDDPSDGVTWQPDVYLAAAAIAKASGATRIVDVGCGRAAKLAAMHPEFEVMGIDYGSNIAYCRETYGFGSWIDHDLEQEGPLPVEGELLRSSVVVCADVIEHLVAPERLLSMLADALAHGATVLVSTPERELWSGIRDTGPPRNPCHVREWSLREFGQLLKASAMPHFSIGLTRSNDRTEELHTILAVVAPSEEQLRVAIPPVINSERPARRHARMAIRLARVLRIAVRG